MDESTAKLSQLSISMNRVDEKIAETNTSISKYENLKKVHYVKENLEKVIEQVVFFAKVCERVQFLFPFIKVSCYRCLKR